MPILLYHTVSDQAIPALKHMYDYRTPAAFEQDVQFLLSNFTVRHLHRRDGFNDVNPSSFLITFDDGLRSLQEYALPFLADKGIPAILFVVPDWAMHRNVWWRHEASHFLYHARSDRQTVLAESLTRVLISRSDAPVAWLGLRNQCLKYWKAPQASDLYLSVQELKHWQEYGFIIGAHSLHHHHFADLNRTQAIDTIIQSMNWVRDNFPYPSTYFAFPYEDFFLSKAFFENLHNHPDAPDVTFGTSGPKADTVPRSVQRWDAEAHGESLQAWMKKERWLQTVRQMLGKNRIQRK